MFSTILLSSVMFFGGANTPPQVITADAITNTAFSKQALVSSYATYNMGHSTIAEAQSFIAAHGNELRAIKLTNVDDDLLQTIKDHCPNLQSFSIVSFYFLEHLTDTGMQIIANFPKLSSLTFEAYWLMDVSSDGMVAMLNGQSSCEELRIVNVDDAAINAISQFTQLKKLHISYFEDVSSSSLEALVGSDSLLQTLTSLVLQANGAHLTNTFVQSLSQYTKMQTLHLSGLWSAKKSSVESLLQALSGLIELELSHLEIDTEHAALIGQMQNLTSLALSNCRLLGSKKDDYKMLLANLKNLTELHLGQAENFTYEECHHITKLPLRYLRLSGTTLSNIGLEILCNSKTLQKSLKSLALIDESSIDNVGFGPLQKLALTTLRLENCPWFNDTSMNLIMDGNLPKNLERIELEKVFLSDATMTSFAKCLKLHTMMFVNNNAVTINGIKVLLKSKPLWKSLQNLYLGEVVVTKDMVPLFGAFKNLQSLLIADALEFNIFTDGEGFSKLSNVVKNKTMVCVFLGPLSTWTSFIDW